MAIDTKSFKNSRNDNRRLYYQIGGITIQVEADLPLTEATFHPKFKLFKADGPGGDTVIVRHHFPLPDMNVLNQGEEIYRKPPWIIYKTKDSWIYVGASRQGIGPLMHFWPRIWGYLCSLRVPCRQYGKGLLSAQLRPAKERHIHLLAVFEHDHTRVDIYTKRERVFRRGNLHSLSLFPTDQILLAQVLAQRQGCYFHAGGVALDGNGFLFVGHSDVGKSTMVAMLKDKAKVLCDDRMIVRKWEDGFRIHGTWSHGDVSDVSSDSAPLRAILFLEQAQENRLIHIERKQEAVRRLLACLIKPFVTADWWDKMLALVNTIAREVPCYVLHFDKSGRVVDVLRGL